MNTTPSVNLPTTPTVKGSEVTVADFQALATAIDKIKEELQRISDNAYHDISLGKSRHQAPDAAPTVDNIDEGVLQVRGDTTPKRLYTRIGDVIYFAELTEV